MLPPGSSRLGALGEVSRMKRSASFSKSHSMITQLLFHYLGIVSLNKSLEMYQFVYCFGLASVVMLEGSYKPRDETIECFLVVRSDHFGASVFRPILR